MSPDYAKAMIWLNARFWTYASDTCAICQSYSRSCVTCAARVPRRKTSFLSCVLGSGRVTIVSCEHQESLQKSYCTCKIIHECFRHVSPQTTLWVDWHVNSTNCSSPHVSLNKVNFLHVQFWTSTFWTMHAFSPKARTCFKRLYKPPGRKNTILIKYSLPPSLIISLR